MPNKLMDIADIPKRKYKRNLELQNAIIKIADVLSPGKAMLIDCEKLGKKPNTVAINIKKLIANGELPGVTLKVMSRGEEVYLVRG